MRFLVAVVIVAVLAAEPEKPQKSAEELYAALKGPWRAGDEKSPLQGVWLHRNEMAPVPPPGTSPWGVIVDFTRGSPEGYRGEPEKVQADGDGLKITLPPAGKEEKRGTRVLRISRDGDKLEVRVTGGCCEGTYTLKRVASKQ